MLGKEMVFRERHVRRIERRGWQTKRAVTEGKACLIRSCGNGSLLSPRACHAVSHLENIKDKSEETVQLGL